MNDADAGNRLIPWGEKITTDVQGAAEPSQSIERQPGRQPVARFARSERMRETDHDRMISHLGVRYDRQLRAAGHLTTKREAW